METMTWNQQVVKKNNKALVIQLIIQNEPISRAGIAQISGLNKATVSSLVNELLEEDLIFESGQGESSGGRRPVNLHFNSVAGFAIGIEIGVNHLLCVLTDLSGTIHIELSEKFNCTPFPSILKKLHKTIQTLMDNMPASRYGVVGIGVGVPGIVNKSGTVLLAPNLGWSKIDLKNELESLFTVPVVVENEANAGAFGEQQFGAGENFENIIYISAGIGIGVGIILNKELFRGKNGFSGEIGHMIIEINGKSCRCGSSGCWEAYASEHALLDFAQSDSLETLIQKARERDSTSIDLFERIGQYLGYGINNIINTFNPDQVIIGNRLALAKEWIESPILSTIDNHTLAHHQNGCQINFSNLGKYSTALGVSAFVVENFVKADEKIS